MEVRDSFELVGLKELVRCSGLGQPPTLTRLRSDVVKGLNILGPYAGSQS